MTAKERQAGGETRPVPWFAPSVYAAVLVAGLYARAAGLAPHDVPRTAGFVSALALLALLDAAEYRRFPGRTPRGAAVALLSTRLVLFAVVNAVDGSQLSRALFVLVPFAAYFAFGRAVALALSGVCVAGLLVALAATEPGWHRDQEQVSDVLMLAVGLALALAMAAVAAGEQRARARLAASAARVAELSAAAERGRLARDIHDSLGHHLTAAGVQLELASELRDLDPGAADRAMTEAGRAVRLALADVRQSVRALRTEPAVPCLADALGDLGRDAGGRPRVTTHIEGDESGYAPAALTALYRAAQEGLTNARRHAAATTVSVELTLGERAARLVVADDGHGFTPDDSDGDAQAQGLGLLGMRERVRLVDGRVDIASRPGAGTTLTVTVPRGGGR
ncbi:sensor histidine kinase [Streptomyces sp. NPDC058739]|uniref:sensor histidine kinase n=1 Tax=Streptomyces sp. NPDC058739 TaxID=3346618 RepID=UPI0036796179